jgi:hypothetical protein
MKYLPHIDAFEFSDNNGTIIVTHTQYIEESFRILTNLLMVKNLGE